MKHKKLAPRIGSDPIPKAWKTSMLTIDTNRVCYKLNKISEKKAPALVRWSNEKRNGFVEILISENWVHLE